MSPWQQSSRVCVFLSMHDEIQTSDILRHGFDSNKLLYIPRYVGPQMDMIRLHSIDDYNSLPETSWKIKQPPENEERENCMDTGGLDLILMPGLGFTASGDRLGRGKGYYDTYLDHYREKFGSLPSTIGLAFNEQLCDTVPTSELDVPIDIVLFENDGR